MIPRQTIETLNIVRDRSLLFVLGGGAGLALWALADHVGAAGLPPALYVALFTFVAGYSAVGLALMGPVPPARALAGALLIALPLTALVSLAGLRFETATELLDDPVMLSVAGLLVLFATPFLSVWLRDRARALDYAALFNTA